VFGFNSGFPVTEGESTSKVLNSNFYGSLAGRPPLAEEGEW
jgi:hypothetical protein